MVEHAAMLPRHLLDREWGRAGGPHIIMVCQQGVNCAPIEVCQGAAVLSLPGWEQCVLPA